MSELLGYGEDALTLRAITERRSCLLESLKDNPDADALCIYRPSFGRRGASQTEGEPSKHSAFGEFDAIIATAKSIYLIESKWHRTSGANKGSITLSENQIRRHQIFEWYLDAWSSFAGTRWDEFVAEYGSNFTFAPTCIAPAESALAKNLQYLLERLTKKAGRAEREGRVVHVLLYFTQEEDVNPAPLRVLSANPTLTSVPTFIPVPMSYKSIGGAASLNSCNDLFY